MKKKAVAAKRRQSCIAMWCKQMKDNKGWNHDQCMDQVSLIIQVLQQMLRGYAAISYLQKDGTPKLARGTLAYYEHFFNTPFQWVNQNGTIPFWDGDAKVWRTFQVENLLDWRLVY